MYEEKTNFGHSSRRKKVEHKKLEDNYLYDGGDQCPDLPLWDKFVLLDGDEDFMDERPSSKRMREDLINQDGDEFDDLPSLQGDDYEVYGARLPWVSLNGDVDSDSDGDGYGDKAAV